MSFLRVIRLKWLAIIGLCVAILIAFNLTHIRIESNLLSSFESWYQHVSQTLAASSSLKETDQSLKVTITLNSPQAHSTPATWILPRTSLLDASERENTSRILQLLNESKVFGLRPLRGDAATQPSLTILVKDSQQEFQIAVSLEDIQDNIQIQNLLKLIDVYSHTEPSTSVEPARL
jgi:hypothetical protein